MTSYKLTRNTFKLTTRFFRELNSNVLFGTRPISYAKGNTLKKISCFKLIVHKYQTVFKSPEQ